MSQYSRSELRDVLVEFYSRVDPARLDAGIDINGMIDWITYHGPDDMNARLQAKYGTSLNFEILNQPKSNQTSALHRISMMPNTQLIEQQSKRLELRAKVEAFYRENDPDKLPTVDTFVEWIEVNGEKAFNDLLMKKYGKVMGVVTRQKPTPPTPPPSSESAPKPSAPTLPPRQNTAPAGPDPVLVSKLTRFYALHEPDQPNDPLPIAEWASSVGIDVLNEKLMQLYGGSLETLDDDESRANEPPPPPPPDREVSSEYAPPLPPPPEDEVEYSYQEEEKPPEPPKVKYSEPPKPPQAPALKFVEPPKKPEPPRVASPPPTRMASPPPMSQAPKPFQAPPKAPQPPKFIQQQKPILPSVPTYKPSGAQNKPAQFVPPPKPPMPTSPTNAGAQKMRKRRPSEGACDNYILDLSGDSFGVCCCGFNRAAHQQPKIKGTDRRSLKIRPTAGNVKQEKPCNNYRVDLAGKNFGDCTCGWGKVHHGKVDWHAPNDPLEINHSAQKPLASIPKPGSFIGNKPHDEVKHHNDNDIIEMAFDQATTTVFNMMVESYVEQHGEQPDEHSKIEWASNLAILSAGKDVGPNPTKLKVKAKAVPKKRG